MKQVTLKSIISNDGLALDADQSIADALETMTKAGISSVIVVDSDNRPIGIFTEHDALGVVADFINIEQSLREVMTPEPFCVEETFYLHDAYAMMEEKGYRHLVVVDEEERFVGVVSEGDFLRHIGFEQLGKFKVVAEAMSGSLLIVSPDTPLFEAAALMHERKSEYAVVLNGSHPSGLITERDIARVHAQKKGDKDVTVEALLHRNFHLIEKSIPLQEAASLMEEHGVHQLIVVDETGNLVGLLSRHDVLHAVHGAYFDYLIRVIEQKNEAIIKIGERKNALKSEKISSEQNALKLRTLFEALPDGVVLIDSITMKAVEFNRSAYERLGYKADEFSELSVSDYEAIESPHETRRRIDAIIQNGQDCFETVHKTKNGKLLDILVNVVSITFLDHPYMMAVYRDITEQKKADQTLRERQQELAKQTAFLRTLVSTIPDLIWLKDTEGTYLACNPMFERLYNAKESEIIGKNDFDFVDPELAQFFRENDNAAMRLGASHHNEEFLQFADGSYAGTFDTIKTPMKDPSGKVIGILGVARDISERKKHEEQLEILANFDPLTGLANRGLLHAHLQNSIDKANRDKTQLALLMFDLDRFKDINDSYGHSAGDELLQMVSERFTSRLREGDLIARLGGDEFAVVLENITRPEDAGRLAQEMLGTLAEAYRLSAGALIHVGASAGIVLFPDHGSDAAILLQHADAALYKAKAEGRGVYHYYTDELTDSARQRIECETRLRRAILNQEFEVYYQPQVHIQTGRIVGAEALIRWNSPVKGLVSPAEFIPIAEEIGLIGEIGEWVLNETCRQGKIWLDMGHRLTLAVNVSAHQVRHQNVPHMVEEALKKSGYPADRLELELTESALMQREEETVEMLHSLRAHGIRLAIDDFGTGYSSLSYLKRFPIDVLKIDKSFVDDIPYERDDMAIVSAIIAMGQALGFQVLAEGTERIEQIDFLREKGCTMYQGYFKSQPLRATEFEKLLH
ncbi:diguanylate cyclase/phosphodiesterase with PAS/PAC sensor(s) [Sulfuricurvum kujiense DSM 16994]|uniref:Diguanylate cyclase/phosphodiesterase with PAS/PAC sensor(S) n=1 Tax=Sulfuricurvum kujiense (strain ATCC BAA-921 / DSM 16994 / JCM 11577 / YK-1) TaxID=709032 RepID=E4TYU9_SULKY|nr:EAL domain-containing protein [Sulfuricurvum kujiense]ADR35109.1 diguanylate cyclase/phosphodiesterase with PAS/PAC sensor(s) [Sulfuricurvum kujiense DSM 16994]